MKRNHLMPSQKGYPTSRTWRRPLQVISFNVLLVIFICACNFSLGIPITATEPDMTTWQKTESPLFPSNWPPTPDTVWISYTFAYGTNLDKLMDGAYVTYPLSKTEWKGSGYIVTELSSDMTQAEVQGILPLDDQTRIILENKNNVSAYCLKMLELPAQNVPETKEMLAYYHAWFKYNDAFLGLIREDHADFIDWVMLNN